MVLLEKKSPQPRAPLDHSPSWVASSCFSQQGSSYVELFDTEARLGSPGQDLRRLGEGPALYINGPPNQGRKMTLERSLQATPRGRFGPQGSQSGWPGAGPAKMTEIMMDRKLACKKSKIGPDPYGVKSNNLWTKHSKALHFMPEDGSVRVTVRPQPFCLRSTSFDPYHLSSKNAWLHQSQSLRSMAHSKIAQSAKEPLRTARSPFPARVRMPFREVFNAPQSR